MSSAIEAQRSTFRNAFLKYGDSPQSTLWNNRATQYHRFELLMRHLPNAGGPFTLHDVGCGLCDLNPFLKEHELPFHYSGSEIVEEMVAFSRTKFPDIPVSLRDIRSASKDEKYDFLVLSGVFNCRASVPLEQWQQYVFEILHQMFCLCSCGIAFNFLTSYVDFRQEDLFYIEPEKMFRYCAANFSRFINLDHSYPLYEATITVFRKEFLRSCFQENEFQKYFSSDFNHR